MAITLLDGLNNEVSFDAESIKEALLYTDIVHDIEEVVSISFFYDGSNEPEINVYDSRSIYDPQTIYNKNEIDDAIEEFCDLIAELEYPH